MMYQIVYTNEAEQDLVEMLIYGVKYKLNYFI